MNIQINCKDDVTENELRYIYHNLESIISKYKNSWEYRSNDKPKSIHGKNLFNGNTN